MNLLRRLKNLYTWSNIDPNTLKESGTLTLKKLAEVHNKLAEEGAFLDQQELATFIDTRKPLDIFPNHPDLDYDETN